jgi:hypothetical protein
MMKKIALLSFVVVMLPMRALTQTLGLKELQDLAICQALDCFQSKVEGKDFDYSMIVYQDRDTAYVFKASKSYPSSSGRQYWNSVVFNKNLGWLSFRSISKPYYKAIKEELVTEGYKHIGQSADGQVLINDYENETHRVRISIRNNRSDSDVFYDVSIVHKPRFTQYLTTEGARNRRVVVEEKMYGGAEMKYEDPIVEAPPMPMPTSEPSTKAKSRTGMGNGGNIDKPNEAPSRFKPKADGFGGRALKVYDAFVAANRSSGRVVLYVCIDAEGNVVSANYRAMGSTTNDDNMKAKAVSNARSCKFEMGSSEGCGTLTYDFVVR